MCWGTTEHMGVQVQVVGSWGTQSWGAQGWGCAALEAHGTGGVWGLYIGNISAEYMKQMWTLHYQLGWDSCKTLTCIASICAVDKKLLRDTHSAISMYHSHTFICSPPCAIHTSAEKVRFSSVWRVFSKPQTRPWFRFGVIPEPQTRTMVWFRTVQFRFRLTV